MQKKIIRRKAKEEFFMKQLKVGVLPGKINEVVLEDGATYRDALNLEGLNPEGYDVKVDNRTITDLDQTIQSGDQLILLVQKVKGNSFKTVKVGVLPGKIQDFAVEEGKTIQEVLNIADLSTEGYDVKVDSQTVTDLNGTYVTDRTNLILLVQKVKGNN